MWMSLKASCINPLFNVSSPLIFRTSQTQASESHGKSKEWKQFQSREMGNTKKAYLNNFLKAYNVRAEISLCIYFCIFTFEPGHYLIKYEIKFVRYLYVFSYLL